MVSPAPKIKVVDPISLDLEDNLNAEIDKYLDIDLYRGYDQPYPQRNPTVRVMDAITGQQYFPNILTNKTPQAYRYRLISADGDDLTARYHINFYDTADGEMHYIEKNAPDLGAAHWKVGIFKNVKIVMK